LLEILRKLVNTRPQTFIVWLALGELAIDLERRLDVALLEVKLGECSRDDRG